MWWVELLNSIVALLNGGAGGGGGTPGGATTSIQFNNAGVFAGSTAFSYVDVAACAIRK